MEINLTNEASLANLTNQEVNKIQELEKELDDQYYLIAFKKQPK